MKIGPIDSHAHLSQPDFDTDRTQVISRAKTKGIQAILSIGTEPQELSQEISLAKDYPGLIYVGLGYHPHIAKSIDDTLYERLIDLIQANNKEVVAIGEIGLDFYYKHSDPKSQERVFREQLRLAEKICLPVIIHCRDAYPQLIRILKTESVPPERVLIHCFSGNSEQAQEFIEWGAKLSFAGPVTYPKKQGLRHVVSITPLDRLMAETDSPYLAPQVVRGRRNEPVYILDVYEKIAQIKGMHIEALIEQICINFSCFFGLPIE